VRARDITVQGTTRLLRKYNVEAAGVQRVLKVDLYRVEVVLTSGKAVKRFRTSTNLGT